MQAPVKQEKLKQDETLILNWMFLVFSVYLSSWGKLPLTSSHSTDTRSEIRHFQRTEDEMNFKYGHNNKWRLYKGEISNIFFVGSTDGLEYFGFSDNWSFWNTLVKKLKLTLKDTRCWL